MKGGDDMSNFIPDPVKAVEKASDQIIVCNWFDADTLEELVGLKISDGEYQEFRDWLKDTDMADECSMMVREFWNEFKHGRKR